MSSRRLMAAVASALMVGPAMARATDSPAAAMPDEEFLEYLGSWDGDDADWIVLQGGPSKPAALKPAERVPKAAGGADQAGGKLPQERMK